MGSGIGGSSKAADCFMATRHRDEAKRTWLRLAGEDAKSGDKGRGWGVGGGAC